MSIVRLIPTPTKNAARRPTFKPKDDFILAREVSAGKRRVSAYGEIQNRFGDAATRANLNRKLSQKVTAQKIQDRYKKIQDAFERRDAADRRLSRLEGKSESSTSCWR